MDIKYCSKCGSKLLGTDMYCCNCGMSITSGDNNKRKRMIIIISLSAISFILVATFLVVLIIEIKKNKFFSQKQDLTISETVDVILISDSVYGDSEKVKSTSECESEDTDNKSVESQESTVTWVLSKKTYSDGSISIYENDSLGRVIKESLFDETGSISIWYEYIYDEKSNLIKELQYNSEGLVRTTDHVYNSKNLIIRTVKYFADGTIESTDDYEYDSDGNTIEHKSTYYNSIFNTAGFYEYGKVIDTKYNYTFDSEGKKAYEEEWIDGVLAYATSYEYAEDTVKETVVVNPTGEITGTFVYLMEYDSCGNLIKRTRYDEDGTILDIYEYVLDKNQNVIKENHFDKDGTLAETIKNEYYSLDVNYSINTSASFPKWLCIKEESDDGRYYENEYDQHGNLIKKTHFNSDGSVFNMTEYLVETDGRILEEISHDGEDKYIFTTKYEYNNDNDLVADRYYNKDWLLIQWHEYEYDSQGNLTKKVDYSGDGKTSGWKVYEYDESNNLIKDSYYTKADTILYYNEYDYFAGGDKIERQYSGGQLVSINEYNYDSAGNILKETYKNSDGIIYMRHEYEYDSNGNLTDLNEYDQDNLLDYHAKYEYAIAD